MFSRFLLPTLVFTATATFAADPKAEAFLDPAAAGPDYAIQGEYANDNGAAQVVALGEGKFRVVGWENGLPGASPEAEQVGEAEAQRTGDTATFAGRGWKGTIAGDTLTATNDEGETFTLKKLVRRSPTLGAKPPVGAIVLFDGSSADAWQGGKVENGLLRCGTKTKQAFGDCTLHVEFRTPFKPFARGQERGNSGVYLQDRHEVQVLDSFGLKGENNECGGIYTVARPRVNMCFPPLTWQSYDIDFEAARYDADGKKTKNAVMTVKHNGVLVHDHVEVPKATTSAGRAEGADPGPIQLQDHGNPVYYRNVWIVERK